MSATEASIVRGKPSRANRRGTAIVEFAVMLPILLTLTLLCVDFGRFAYYDIAVTNAARAGAAYGSSHLFTPSGRAAWEAQVRQAAVDELFCPNNPELFEKMTMPSPIVTQDGNGSWHVQVDVSYPFQTLLNWPFLPTVNGHRYHDPLMLHRSVVMRGTI